MAISKGVILFGHGSRDPLWRQPIEAVAARLGARGVAVSCAYLELDQPDLPTAAGHLIGQGARQLTIVPMFLGTGKHARADLPEIVQALRQAHPHVQINLQRAVGEDPRVLDLLALIALE